MAIIKTEKLNKHYKGKAFSKETVHALKDFSFEVEPGEIFGLLGPNGAGKTTLVKILLGITFPTTGNAKIFDTDIRNESYKHKIGYLPENHKFPNYLTGKQLLMQFGKLNGLSTEVIKKRSEEYVSMLELGKKWESKVKTYSKGEMQRLGLAQALINEPDLLFLDEPTDGVDVIGKVQIRQLLLDLKAKGKTIFLNSHLLAELQEVCDRVAILNHGTLLRVGSVSDITSTGDNYIITTSDLSNELVNTLLNEYRVSVSSNNTFAYKTSSIEEVNKLIDLLRSSKVLIHSLVREKNTLESSFINIIKEDRQN